MWHLWCFGWSCFHNCWSEYLLSKECLRLMTTGRCLRISLVGLVQVCHVQQAFSDMKCRLLFPSLYPSFLCYFQNLACKRHDHNSYYEFHEHYHILYSHPLCKYRFKSARCSPQEVVGSIFLTSTSAPFSKLPLLSAAPSCTICVPSISKSTCTPSPGGGEILLKT
jgi:hypothetical protein